LDGILELGPRVISEAGQVAQLGEVRERHRAGAPAVLRVVEVAALGVAPEDELVERVVVVRVVDLLDDLQAHLLGPVVRVDLAHPVTPTNRAPKAAMTTMNTVTASNQVTITGPSD